jgi:molecular chaperone GrpE
MVSNEQEPLENQIPTEEVKIEVNTDQPDEAALPADETTETANPLAALEAKLTEANDKYLRLYAEFENFRRRTNKEKLEMRQFASEDLMKKLLDVVDDFERAAIAIDKTQTLEAATEGFSIVKNRLFKLLEVQGLKAMNCAGEVFDADLHESITSIPAPSDDMKGKIIDEIQKGYFLNEKPIRFAKVVIGA